MRDGRDAGPRREPGRVAVAAGSGEDDGGEREAAHRAQSSARCERCHPKGARARSIPHAAGCPVADDEGGSPGFRAAPSRSLTTISKERFSAGYKPPLVSSLSSHVGRPPSLDSRIEALFASVDLSEVADSSVNVLEELGSDPRWQPTALRLTDLGYLWEERLECASRHALPLTSDCHGAIDMVVDASSSEVEAPVIFARSSAAPELPEDADACTSYVQCLASSRIGSRLPVPAHLIGTGLIAINTETIYTWSSPMMHDKDKVAELINLRKASLIHAIENKTFSEYELLGESDLIEYLELHLSRLKGER